MRLAVTALAVAMALAFPARAQEEPNLVPAVSQDEVEIRSSFTGAELLLFGAVIQPDGSSAGRDSDVVVIVSGPSRPIIVREKQRVAGIWLNADSTRYSTAPAFFAVASSRPISDLVDERTALIFELGLDYLNLSPSDPVDPEEQQRFRDGLVDLYRRQGLYAENGNAVSISEGVLYQARIRLPANVPVGSYRAETFLVRDGKVLASASRSIDVRKRGFEGFVAALARYQSLTYGLIAVAISLTLGWIAGRIFARR